MTSLNISLPKSMKEYVESRVEAGGFSTPSEFMRALVREDQKRQAEEKLEALLIEGLESGPPIDITPEWWQALQERLQARYNQKASE